MQSGGGDGVGELLGQQGIALPGPVEIPVGVFLFEAGCVDTWVDAQFDIGAPDAEKLGSEDLAGVVAGVGEAKTWEKACDILSATGGERLQGESADILFYRHR